MVERVEDSNRRKRKIIHLYVFSLLIVSKNKKCFPLFGVCLSHKRKRITYLLILFSTLCCYLSCFQRSPAYLSIYLSISLISSSIISFLCVLVSINMRLEKRMKFSLFYLFLSFLCFTRPLYVFI